MRRLDRYVLFQLIGSMVFITVVLTAAIWLAQSLRLIDLIVNKGLSVSVFFYLVLLVLPRFLDVILPIALFIAVIFTYAKLTAESELVVMRAVGLGPAGLARPALMLAAAMVVLLFILSGWVLPAATRAFKDLQFQIRHQFVSAVLQEGTFTPLADELTVYVRERTRSGELTGILVQDDRDKLNSVTIIADRGVLVETPSGPRVVMENGNRQQLDRTNGKLSMLTFDRYTLDLGEVRDAPVGREREARERDLDDLWIHPPSDRTLLAERHIRIAAPLGAVTFVLLPLACLLTGEFNRRGQAWRILAAVALVFLFEGVDLSLRTAASNSGAAIPLMYVWSLGPAVVAGWVLLRERRGGVRPLAAAGTA
ncbi:MAG: LPS export ABC transporter permease LptF [Rhodospirillales bacterium]|nr:LPS export ABC transporter permease LptF [Rhodospirillales bacterium]